MGKMKGERQINKFYGNLRTLQNSVCRVHPLATRNICTKCHSNLITYTVNTSQRQQTYHSHKHLMVQLWTRLCMTVLGSVKIQPQWEVCNYILHYVTLKLSLRFICTIIHDLTELTMSLRAWKPDKTGKTCSVPSAISASCVKNKKNCGYYPSLHSLHIKTFLLVLVQCFSII